MQLAYLVELPSRRWRVVIVEVGEHQNRLRLPGVAVATSEEPGRGSAELWATQFGVDPAFHRELPWRGAGHTPGPWRVAGLGVWSAVRLPHREPGRVGVRYRLVALLPSTEAGGKDASITRDDNLASLREAEENARLVALAPLMLEACHQARAALLEAQPHLDHYGPPQTADALAEVNDRLREVLEAWKGGDL